MHGIGLSIRIESKLKKSDKMQSEELFKMNRKDRVVLKKE
jgi:hypothetical protein